MTLNKYKKYSIYSVTCFVTEAVILILKSTFFWDVMQYNLVEVY
jgi:hypothetical protein